MSKIKLAEPFYLNILLMGDNIDVLHTVRGVRDKEIHPIWIPVMDYRYVGSPRRNEAVTLRKAYYRRLNKYEVWAKWKFKTVRIETFNHNLY